jgi:hypothetical protein
LFLNDCYNYSGISLDIALVDSALDVKVTRLAPWAPRVADDPVVDSVECSPADNDHTVVDGFIVARDVIVDAPPVLTIVRGNERASNKTTRFFEMVVLTRMSTKN